MANRYAGAGGGIARMNEIMNAILLKPMSINEVAWKIDMGLRATRGYLRKLEAAGKLICKPGPSDKREKIYILASGAMPFDQVRPKNPPCRPPVTTQKKRGPKPGTKKSTAAEDRRIKTVPAQNLGMPRDPLVAAFFGWPLHT